MKECRHVCGEDTKVLESSANLGHEGEGHKGGGSHAD